MEMNINEKKALYAFGCPVLKATVERLRMLAAITPDPGTKKLFYTLAIKLLDEGCGAIGIAVSFTISALRWKTISMPSSL